MGLFGDLDVASGEADPFHVPANTYEADLYKAEVKDKDDKKALILTYKISDGPHKGKTVGEFKTIPQPADPNNLTEDESKARNYLTQRLASLGIPKERMNSVDTNDLQGLAVVITVVNNGEYTNVRKVELRESSPAARPAQEFAGFGG